MNVDSILGEINKNLDGDENFDLYKIEKQFQDDLAKQQVMLYKDFYDIEYDKIQNFHKKIILYNLPDANNDEIMQYYHTFLTSLQTVKSVSLNITKPIMNIERNNNFFEILPRHPRANLPRRVLQC